MDVILLCSYGSTSLGRFEAGSAQGALGNRSRLCRPGESRETVVYNLNATTHQSSLGYASWL